MGELLRLYLGKDQKTSSQGFWLGASRVLDSRPVLSGDLAVAVANDLSVEDVTEGEAWSVVGEELRAAIDKPESK